MLNSAKTDARIGLPVEDSAGPGSSDLLAESILYIAKHHGRTLSPTSLLSGLPLDAEGRLTPRLAEVAAVKAGFAARIVKSPLGRIASFALPAVLFLREDAACVLLDFRDGEYRVAHPSVEGGEQVMAQEDLARVYSGFVMYLVPESKTELRMGQVEGRPSRRWLRDALLKNWWPYSQVLIAALILNLLALATPLFVMNVYDRVVPNSAVDTLWVLTSGMLVVIGFDFVIKGLRAHFIDRTGKRIDIELEARLFDQILGIRLKDKPASAGSFANLLRELEVLRDFFTSATLVSFVDLPFIFLFIIMFWFIGGPIAFVFMAALPLILLIGLAIHFPLKKSVEASMATGQGKHAVLVETLGSLETVKGLGCEAAMSQRWNQSATDSARHAVRSRSLSHLALNLTAIVQQTAYVVIIIIGVYLIKDGTLTSGGLIACSILSGRVMGPFAQIAQLITRLHHTMSAYKALDAVMALEVERENSNTFLHRPVFRGNLEFRDVGFSYPGASLPALRNVSLKIKAGERVAVVGKTGSGKSTMGKLLLSLYTPDQGAVLVDGTDLRQVDPADLRRWTGYMPQEVVLFQGTVRQNICVAHPQATDREILEAAHISGTNDFMRTHPQGYGLHVSERGSSLSGGQRQSISVARALLRNPNILVMDEPTSSMDTQSEALLVKRLKALLPGRTIVLITHRPTLLELVDRLIVMDEGQVVADGPKDVVLRQLQSGAVPAAQAQNAGGVK
ncbi:MAG: type I secretion system permease/ATPase [Desulfomicrobium sp.]